jgi:hypothetical protein
LTGCGAVNAATVLNLTLFASILDEQINVCYWVILQPRML